MDKAERVYRFEPCPDNKLIIKFVNLNSNP